MTHASCWVGRVCGKRVKSSSEAFLIIKFVYLKDHLLCRSQGLLLLAPVVVVIMAVKAGERGEKECSSHTTTSNIYWAHP